MGTLSEYSVDVWFLYGSFTYGLETRVHSLSGQSLTLEVELGEADTPEDVSRFLETLIENPRGLLRSEICLYGPDEDEPIRLYTEVSPTFTQIETHSLRLRFSHVSGLTPRDSGHWHELLDHA